MVIKNKKVGTKGMFYVGNDEKILAEMVYTMASPDKMIIEHTEVSKELKGQNVGSRLVKTAVEFARAHNIKIIPLCPLPIQSLKRSQSLQIYWLNNYEPSCRITI
jgi:predicted GNAT family acetyltransferase